VSAATFLDIRPWTAVGTSRDRQKATKKGQRSSLVAWRLGMGRRIDIELTSKREDGTWTWRAPGARQPRGVVDGGLVPDGAGPGSVYKAEADFELEGIFVTSVLGARQEHKGREGERIELLGSSSAKSTVSVSLASRGDKRRRNDLFEDRPPPKRRAAVRGERRTEKTERDESERPQTRRPVKRAEGPKRPSDRPARNSRNGERPERGRPRAAQVSTTHRNAALAALRPEQLPVAEQLLRGGIPALRKAIEEQNNRARAEGRAEVDPEALLHMADELLPKMNLAAWKDRAVAARAADRDCPLRELRAVVAASSTVNVDEEGRELATSLRKTLETRVTALRDSWLGRIGSALEAGRVVDALQAASRAPDPSMRLPADLAVRLSEAAGQALSEDLDEEAWTAVLQAVVGSPVRRTVKPAGIPAGAGDALMNAARSAAGTVPQLARLLGLPIPPPPGPRRPPRPLGATRRAAPA
jgi:hypothetical protein